MPVGVGGTSAGAIVAALVAIGFHADELINPISGATVLGGRSPTSWLGRTRWLWFRVIRASTLPVAVVFCLALLIDVVAVEFRGGGRIDPGLPGRAVAVLAASAGVLLALFFPLNFVRGLFPSRPLRELINGKLRDKLREHYRTLGIDREPPSRVTFADIDPTAVSQCRVLKVVTSDVRGRELVLFDASTPCVSVADAVMASASIPIAFAPPAVSGWADGEDRVFADGGLVSNLPSWVFNIENRALQREQQGSPVPILAFTLKDAKQAGRRFGRPSLREYAPRRWRSRTKPRARCLAPKQGGEAAPWFG